MVFLSRKCRSSTSRAISFPARPKDNAKANTMPPKVMEKAASVSYPRVNELIHGKRGVTRDTALRLERLLGMEAQFWLNLQLAWDLYHVKHSPAAKEIAKVKKLPQRTKV